MDEIERQMCRARAKWRQKLNGETTLWRFENWVSERKEEHHIARWKFGNATVPVWISMHQELTRRMMEEHPPEGPDPTNPFEKLARHFLGAMDIHECLVDFYRSEAERLIAAGNSGEVELSESAYSRDQLCALMRIVQNCLDVIAMQIGVGPRE